MERPLRIGIVAGELSGDTLGEGFIKAIKLRYPDAEFVGIGGPKMMQQGCQSLFDMEELSVMGLVEVLGRLPRLLKVKAELVKYFTQNPPDVFIGIDAPDFNLRLELDLKNAGIKTVHYVSPSVWAWRQKRIFGIAKATNLVLAFLPFEKAFYDKFNVPCEFIGHTLADAIPLKSDKAPARELLGLAQDKSWLAVLPGSRGSELNMLAEPFIQACKRLHAQQPDLGFVVALVNQKRREQFEAAWREYAPELEFVLVDDTAKNVITAADAVMLASGTVALECMLIKRPMVVGYKVNAFTAFLARRMLKTKYVSLPNILADQALVKEFLQQDCTPENLSQEVLQLLGQHGDDMVEKFTEMHHWIRKDADTQAANAVLSLIGKSKQA
ncbi:lipid-A-disaccharide synthase [Vibrio scophthalmi]|uniref:Lipid-A-disaccharide synthase n=2 Tax=Vibrio scophthalmi TaxID=45658 RepID=F9RJT2_9VIBR|nr:MULTISPECIES: lipid-A-disaccharide synthase [Vibrio]ANU37228.1 Lipid-A-disaccharide synthase [Vibrio scophthalmi]EGU36895.1 lipid-A-disaccharide synthase [Vibrio sp. N418]EGU40559.1 lipid-A-disaccharide synthase [Vibrio scophthalmi LMG 19158]